MSRPSPHPRALAGGARRRRRRCGARSPARSRPRRSGAGSTRPTPPATASCPRSSLVAGVGRRPARRGGGRRRARRAARRARRRHQPRRAGHRPGHRRRLLQARPHPRDRPGRRAAPASQPGVIQASLNAAAAPLRPRVRPRHLHRRPGDDRRHGRQQLVGLALDRLRRDQGQGARASHAVLAGGEAAALRRRAPAATSRSGLARAGGGAARGGARGRCASATAEPIAAGFPRTPPLHLRLQPARAARAASRTSARLLAGSEGTLALFTELEVLLDPRPARARRARRSPSPPCARALEANVAILETGPVGGRAARPRAAARARPTSRTYRAHGAAAGRRRARRMLTVEYQGERGRGARRARAPARARRRPRRDAGRSGSRSPTALAEAAALRRAVLPLLMGAPGAERPAAFVEDTAVAPERLADFVDDFQRLVAAHGARASLHRPRLGRVPARPAAARPQDGGRRARAWSALAAEVGRLVAELPRRHLRRARLRALAQLVPAAACSAPGSTRRWSRVKDAFDPRRLLGPGRRRRRPAGGRVPALRRRLPRRPAAGRRGSRTPPRAASTWPSRSASAPACARSSPGTMCPPGRGDARRGAHHAGARQRAAGRGLRRRAAGGHRRGRVPRRARHLRRLQGVQDGVPGRRRHGGAQGGVAGRAARAGGRARRWRAASATSAGWRRWPRRSAPLVNALGAHPRRARLVDRPRSAWRRERPLPAFARRPLTRRLAAAPRAGAPARRRHGRALRGLLHPVPGAGGRRGAGAPARAPPACAWRSSTPAAAAARRSPRARSRRRARAARRALGGAARRAPRRRATSLFIEPRCLSMVRDDWRAAAAAATRASPRSPPPRARRSRSSPTWPRQGRLHFRAGGRALLHSHCHEKALGFAAATRARAGAPCPASRSRISDAGCCGMSGVFGYEAEHYELSVAMAERALLPAVRAGAARRRPCWRPARRAGRRSRDLGGRAAVHPLEFLAGRLEG